MAANLRYGSRLPRRFRMRAGRPRHRSAPRATDTLGARTVTACQFLAGALVPAPVLPRWLCLLAQEGAEQFQELPGCVAGQSRVLPGRCIELAECSSTWETQ